MAAEMNRSPPIAHPVFSAKKGQYLAFIYAYTIVLGRPPAEADLQHHFRVTPPSVHQMILTLERQGLIRRQPGTALHAKIGELTLTDNLCPTRSTRPAFRARRDDRRRS